MIPIFPGGLGVAELACVAVIIGNAQGIDLTNAVTAGAFVQRLFTWLLPIIVGLAAWRRGMVANQASDGGDGSTEAAATSETELPRHQAKHGGGRND